MTEVNWGPTGQLVYERTYSRVKPDGERETWPETVERVVDGNLALGDPRHELPTERDALIRLMTEFKILPAGRHLWASGVKGRQYLFNCHVSGWGENVPEHFEFTFLRLMEGGGVGANYSNKHLARYPEVEGFRVFADRVIAHENVLADVPEYPYEVHIVCDPEHPDYEILKSRGVLSEEYDSEWDGAFAVEDSREGWADALVDLINTYYREAENAKRVFDVSRVRGEGSRLKTFGGRASGPLPLALMLQEVSDILNGCIGEQLDGISAMEIDHAIAKCVVSGGNRRSARMSIMHWNDPQINEFLIAKAGGLRHWTTNMSVEVDDEFFRLINTPDTSGHQARIILEAIADGMLNNGEPGFWNSSLSNVGEPNEVISTNPCGEIALEPWENCNLGHVSLAAFVDSKGNIDFIGMLQAHRLMTRFLIRATYGDVNDPKQAEKLARNRRIGVGHLGVASYLAKVGIRYSDAWDNDAFINLLEVLSATVDEAAEGYAHDLRIPVPVKKRTVAPTGTIAKLSGVSEGIHPIFGKYFIRRIRFSTVDPDQVKTLEEYAAKGYDVQDDQYADMTKVVSIPTMDTLVAEVDEIHGEGAGDAIVESAADLTLVDMLRFQALYQHYWADNAVSYTANVNPATCTTADVVEVIREIGPLLKGATVFPEASLPQAPYQRITKEDWGLYEFWQRQVSDGIDEACANGGCPVK